MATAERAGSRRRGARRAYWRRQIEAHRRSGLSQVAFCAQRGLRTGTLSFWKWKFGREAGPAPRRAAIGTARATAARPFIPIRITGPQATRTADGVSGMPDGVEIEITLGPGRGLRVQGRVDPAWLVQVLRGIAAC